MPTYLDPLQGVSLSEAAAEAAAIAPVQRAMLDTLEFRRSTIVDGEGDPAAIRLVNDKQDLTATLEEDAALNAGEAVLFTRCAMRPKRPAENGEASSPTFELEIDGVSSLAIGLFRQNLDSMEPVLMTYRRYASDDTSGPAELPVLTMEVTAGVVADTVLRITASFGDPINEAFPGKTYTRAEYPTLQAR